MSEIELNAGALTSEISTSIHANVVSIITMKSNVLTNENINNKNKTQQVFIWLQTIYIVVIHTPAKSISIQNTSQIVPFPTSNKTNKWKQDQEVVEASKKYFSWSLS